MFNSVIIFFYALDEYRCNIKQHFKDEQIEMNGNHRFVISRYIYMYIYISYQLHNVNNKILWLLIVLC